MNTLEQQPTPPPGPVPFEPNRAGLPHDLKIFEVWKEYEGVAMHFNDLLLRLRTQALGGVAAIATVAAVIVRGDIGSGLRWGVLTASFTLLSVFWIAVWILDIRYYNRLLLGAVEAILEIENESETAKPVDRIILSTRIEQVATGKRIVKQSSLIPVNIFYTIVLVGLLGSSVTALIELCASN
jgi:hypothetical protein